MNNRKITVLLLPAGGHEAVVVQIEDDLKTYQEYVDGHIEIVNLNGRTALVVNDEGLILGLQENPIATVLYWSLCGRPVTPICGNALIVGVRSKDGEFASVPPSAVFMVNRIISAFKEFQEDDKGIEV